MTGFGRSDRKDRVTMIRRPASPRGPRAVRRLPALVLLAVPGMLVMPAVLPLAARAADLPPAIVADFTRRVQPLVLNRCAAGGCHGGSESPAPKFVRRDPRGGIDRRTTLANMQAVLEAVGPERDASRLALLLASRHPASAKLPTLTAPPLTPQERATLDGWLAAVRASERRIYDPALRQASAQAAVAPPLNRFQALLDAAANPPQLPPPQEPQGVIFPKDVPPAE
jgi:hypothetical protein